jgi:hypothetical protein
MHFYENIQMPINLLCIHQIFMLELSPASTQCTHGAALSCFAGKGHWRPSHPVVGGKLDEWQEPFNLW